MLSWLLMTVSLQAQGNNVRLNLKNANLEQVIWEIQKQTSYFFLYGSRDVKSITGLEVHAEGRPALDVLSDCLKNTNLTFTVEQGNVVIKKVEPSPQPQQKVVIEGVVKDEKGETLPGVTVMVKGTNTGMATDLDGKFRFEAAISNGAVIVFTFVGLEQKEVVYNGQKTINVVMTEGSQRIDEVVVTGYQKIDRRLFTGSADIVKAEDMKVAGADAVSRMLQGKSWGVQIQNVAGTFGAAPKMRVR